MLVSPMENISCGEYPFEIVKIYDLVFLRRRKRSADKSFGADRGNGSDGGIQKLEAFISKF